MKRRILSVLLLICLLASVFPTGAWAADVDTHIIEGLTGSGTEDAQYLITSKEDLMVLANAVNKGNTLQGCISCRPTIFTLTATRTTRGR